MLRLNSCLAAVNVLQATCRLRWVACRFGVLRCIRGSLDVFPSNVDLSKNLRITLRRHEHSWSTDRSVIAPRIAGLHLSTQGFGKPEFQEIEEIQMNCRKSPPVSEALTFP